MRPAPYGVYAQALTECCAKAACRSTRPSPAPGCAFRNRPRARWFPGTNSKLAPAPALFARAPGAPPPAVAIETQANMRARPIRDYPVDQAFAATLEQDTISGLCRFPQRLSQLRLRPRVRAMLAVRREAMTWRRACLANTPNAYWTYLQRYPRGPHAGDARRRLATINAALTAAAAHSRCTNSTCRRRSKRKTIYFRRPYVVFDDPDWGRAAARLAICCRLARFLVEPRRRRRLSRPAAAAAHRRAAAVRAARRRVRACSMRPPWCRRSSPARTIITTPITTGRRPSPAAQPGAESASDSSATGAALCARRSREWNTLAAHAGRRNGARLAALRPGAPAAPPRWIRRRPASRLRRSPARAGSLSPRAPSPHAAPQFAGRGAPASRRAFRAASRSTPRPDAAPAPQPRRSARAAIVRRRRDPGRRPAYRGPASARRRIPQPRPTSSRRMSPRPRRAWSRHTLPRRATHGAAASCRRGRRTPRRIPIAARPGEPPCR